MKKNSKATVIDARTKTLDFTDPLDKAQSRQPFGVGPREEVLFTRTAVVVEPSSTNTGSLDLVRMIEGQPVRIGQINLHLLVEGAREVLMVDVIDSEGRYKVHRAIGFQGARPTHTNTDSLVGAHFESSPS